MTKKLVQELAKRENVNQSLITKRNQLLELIRQAQEQNVQVIHEIRDYFWLLF